MINLPNLGDLLRYLKENSKNFVYSFLLSLIFAGGIYLISNSDTKITSDTTDGFQYEFNFIIENQVGSLINNPKTLKYVINKHILENKDSFGKIDYKTLLEDYEVVYDSDIAVMTLKTKENNADIFYKIIKSKESTYFSNKNVYLLDPEVIKSSEVIATEATVPNGKISKPKLVIILAITIILITLIIGVIFTWLKEIKSKEITSQFSLNSDKSILNLEKHNLSSSEIKTIISNLLNENEDGDVIILAESSDFVSKIGMNDYNQFIFQTIASETLTLQSVKEVIILVEKKKTSKLWYNVQLELLKNRDLKITTIYVGM